MKTVKTPELDKMAAVHEKSQAIGEFLEWLRRGWAICRFENNSGFAGSDTWIPLPYSINSLLSTYFGIDQAVAEQERHALLAMIRGEESDG